MEEIEDSLNILKNTKHGLLNSDGKVYH